MNQSNTKTQEHRQIIVLGMHRSGTSALMGALNGMGVYVGRNEELTKSSWENPLGFFERYETRTICEALLHRSGADWARVSSFLADNVSHTATSEFTPAIVKLIKELDSHGTWALKEPRLCFLFPIFQRALRRPVILHIIRNPLDVANSLRRRNGFPLRAGLALWEAYNLAALKHADALQRIFLKYEDLVSEPEATLETLASSLSSHGVNGLDPGRGVAAIDSSLRRETHSDELDWMLTSDQRLLWQALSSHAVDTLPRSPSREALHTLREFEADESDRQHTRTELRSQIQQVAALSQTNSELVAEIKALKETVEEQAALKRRMAAQAEGAAKLRDEVMRALGEESTTSSALKAELEAAVGKNAQLESKNTQLESMIEEMNGRCQSLTTDLAMRIAAVTDLSKQVTSRDAEIEALSARLAAEEAARGRETNQLRARDEHISQLTAAARAHDAELADLRGSASWRLMAPVRASARLVHWILRDVPSGPRELMWLVTGQRGKIRARHADRTAHRVLANSELFDAEWYLRRYPDVAESDVDVLDHFRTHGWLEGRDPGPNFSTQGYLSMYPDVEESGENPLVHYLVHGHKESRQANPHLPDLTDAAVETPCDSSVADEQFDRDIELINASRLFDRDWYMRQYSDVGIKGADPVVHYLRYGARELRDPGPHFNTEWYLQQNGDMRQTGLNPLVHYLRFGQAEQRLAAPVSGSSAWWESLAPAANPAPDLDSCLGVAKALRRMSASVRWPTVVVPVFNAPDETDACLTALARHTDAACRILVIDDASSEPQVLDVLSRHAATGRIELHPNAENLGFTRTVNKGIELAGESDVVLLNSDTQVTPGWLRNLRLAAYSDDRVGTATPFSNNAGAFSAPEIGKPNDVPAWLGLDEYARVISQASLRLYPQTPTGNGFCLYLRRDCIAETGLFDAEAFPRGYGEENDFCMRAGMLGWSHVVDDATLIFHVRSASFGDAKTGLMTQGRKVIDERYPDYSVAVRKLIASPELEKARRRVRQAARAVTTEKRAVKPRVLYVLSTRTGGTPQTNQDLMTALDDRIDTFVLRCDSKNLSLSYFHDDAYVEMEGQRLEKPLQAFPHRSDEYDAFVAEWMVRYSIELVHIRHIAWHGLGLIDMAKGLGIPVVFSFHDFYTICPTVKLLDQDNVYCAGKCTATQGECRHELWPKQGFPALKHAGISDWQSHFSAVLKRCDGFITTTKGTSDVLKGAYPFLSERPFWVIPHGREFDTFEQSAPPVGANENVRLLVPGNISNAKGGQAIVQLVSISATLDRELEIHILGNVAREVEVPDSVVLHGAYSRSEFAAKVAQIRPHVGGVFSIWPETFCHTLTELWASGVPVIGFDYGAVGDRIRETDAGWLTDSPTASGVLSIIEHLLSNPDEHAQKIAAVQAWQNSSGTVEDCSRMGHAYYDVYRMLLTNSPAASMQRRPILGMLAPMAHVRAHKFQRAPASTFVRLAAKTGDNERREVRYDACDQSWTPLHLASYCDALIVQRSAILSLLSSGESDETLDRIGNYERRVSTFVETCKQTGLPLVLDVDDDLVGRAEISAPDDDYFGMGYAIERLLHAVDLIFVSTEPLKEQLWRFNSNVVVEPNAISERLWLSPLDGEVDASTLLPAKADDEVWAIYVGTETHTQDLDILREAVLRTREAVPGFRLFIVGITDRDEAWYESIPVSRKHRDYPRFVPWVRRLFETMDFGLAPLVDTPFNRSKSDLKFLEYSAAKLACLASDVGPYRASIRDQETGILVQNSPSAWSESLIFAARNPVQLKEIARRAYADVVAHRLCRDREAHLDRAVLSVMPRRGRESGRRQAGMMVYPTR